MQDARTAERIRRAYEALRPEMDERMRRQWAAAEADALGWGGVTAVAHATGLSRVHVARTLETLRQRRLAEIQDGTLVLFDRARLADLSGYVPLRVAAGRRAII